MVKAVKCGDGKPPKNKKPKPKTRLSDEERHKRFVDLAREVGASENSEAFDKAFSRVAIARHRRQPTSF